MSSLFSVEDMDYVRRITLTQPDRRNPLSYALAHALHDMLIATQQGDKIKSVILTGSGKAFCVGGDQKDFQEGFSKSSPEVYDDYPPMKVFKLVRNYKKPLIVAVNGMAYGGGMGITCASHIAIASEDAAFGIPEIKLGIFPLTIIPVIRPILGEKRMMDLALTGRSMLAAEALSIGLVSRVVPGEKLQEEALKLARDIGSFSPLALKLGLSATQMSIDMGFDEAIDYLNAIRTIFFASEDLNEGATAFLEKRKPVWRGK